MPMSPDIIANQLKGLELQFRVSAHNIANSTTAGFKRRFTVFASTMERQMGRNLKSGTSDEGGSESLSAVATLDFSPGVLKRTGRHLDVAIKGDGFFVVDTATGPVYTRNGTFRTNSKGKLVDSMGRGIVGTKGPIVIPPSASHSQIHISTKGEITAAGQPIGQLSIMDFKDKTILMPVGNSCFRPTDTEVNKPTPVKDAEVHQHHIEQSNVRTLEEVVGLISISRMYEANMKSLRLQDGSTETLLQVAVS